VQKQIGTDHGYYAYVTRRSWIKHMACLRPYRPTARDILARLPTERRIIATVRGASRSHTSLEQLNRRGRGVIGLPAHAEAGVPTHRPHPAIVLDSEGRATRGNGAESRGRAKSSKDLGITSRSGC